MDKAWIPVLSLIFYSALITVNCVSLIESSGNAAPILNGSTHPEHPEKLKGQPPTVTVGTESNISPNQTTATTPGSSKDVTATPTSSPPVPPALNPASVIVNATDSKTKNATDGAKVINGGSEGNTSKPGDVPTPNTPKSGGVTPNNSSAPNNASSEHVVPTGSSSTNAPAMTPVVVVKGNETENGTTVAPAPVPAGLTGVTSTTTAPNKTPTPVPTSATPASTPANSSPTTTNSTTIPPNGKSSPQTTPSAQSTTAPQTTTTTASPVTTTPTPTTTAHPNSTEAAGINNGTISPERHPETDAATKEKEASRGGMGAGGVFGIIFLLVVVLSGAGWIFYAYSLPHTPSGQLLIRCRPSRWHIRRTMTGYASANFAYDDEANNILH